MNKIDTIDDMLLQDKRATEDLLYVYHSKMYINEKGYLTKVIDLLRDLGYYEDNESLFIR